MKKNHHKRKTVDPFEWLRKARGQVVRIPRCYCAFGFGKLCAVTERKGLMPVCRVLSFEGDVIELSAKDLKPAHSGDAELFNEKFARSFRNKEIRGILKK